MATRKSGSKWIRKQKRLAIYLRDGMACVFCGATIEDGATLSLDHQKCHSHGGSNGADNLVTACRKCNSVRGTRNVAEFCNDVAQYIGGVSGDDIVAEIDRLTATPLKPYVAEAKAIMSRRPVWQNALKSATRNS